MEITPFGNTAGFGSLMRTLRVKALLSFESMAKRGGPSDRYQKDIESGASMPITVETRLFMIEGVERSAAVGL